MIVPTITAAGDVGVIGDATKKITGSTSGGVLYGSGYRDYELIIRNIKRTKYENVCFRHQCFVV
ncbi:MAG: hypothetical protein LBJ79_04145 [Endomicrobium sp.]|jgi:hypothetical protein|nr:hypothetical protein [Endomicrobium sp.]